MSTFMPRAHIYSLCAYQNRRSPQYSIAFFRREQAFPIRNSKRAQRERDSETERETKRAAEIEAVVLWHKLTVERGWRAVR